MRFCRHLTKCIDIHLKSLPILLDKQQVGSLGILLDVQMRYLPIKQDKLHVQITEWSPLADHTVKIDIYMLGSKLRCPRIWPSGTGAQLDGQRDERQKGCSERFKDRNKFRHEDSYTNNLVLAEIITYSKEI